MSALTPLVMKRNAFKTFAHDADNGLGHAYLFLSEDGLVREEFLLLAAKRVFCKRICGVCPSCLNIDGGSHYDVKSHDGGKLKVKDINELTESAAVKPVSGDRKLYLIDNADRLSAQAQNKLLKTYEEPPSFVTVILAASDENGLLPTIRSRAKKLCFDSLTAREIIACLVADGYGETEAGIAAAVGAGSLERAEAFLSDDVHASLYDGCFELLLSLDSSARIAEYLYGNLFTKENILMTLDFMEIILCDVMKLAGGSGAPLQTAGREFDTALIAGRFNAQSAAMALYAVNEGRKKLNFNINSASVAEGILFDILEARYKWQ